MINRNIPTAIALLSEYRDFRGTSLSNERREESEFLIKWLKRVQNFQDIIDIIIHCGKLVREIQTEKVPAPETTTIFHQAYMTMKNLVVPENSMLAETLCAIISLLLTEEVKESDAYLNIIEEYQKQLKDNDNKITNLYLNNLSTTEFKEKRKNVLYVLLDLRNPPTLQACSLHDKFPETISRIKINNDSYEINPNLPIVYNSYFHTIFIEHLQQNTPQRYANFSLLLNQQTPSVQPLKEEKKDAKDVPDSRNVQPPLQEQFQSMPSKEQAIVQSGIFNNATPPGQPPKKIQQKKTLSGNS